jgi:lipopolysaccharide/colanic/teichoic acid biosynthesis glycosyltransferase
MRVWPIIVDSQPAYLRGNSRSTSLLLVPFGTGVLGEQVTSAVRVITDNHPIIIAPPDVDPLQYSEALKQHCPSATIITTVEQLTCILSFHELSDALLFVDPRCWPAQPGGLSHLLRHHTAEPRVSHHLVAFEQANAGTKERVAFDPAGQVRGIQRFYEQTTWPFISGIAATLVPCSCGALAEHSLPTSLVELRQSLIAKGVPSRDVPIDGIGLDLADERGLLSANEHLILDATAHRPEGHLPSSPLYIGSGQNVHPDARLMGPIVIHPGASVAAGATVLGPAVIGSGATISTGAVIAHAVIGPGSTVPSGVTVRDRAWFKTAEEARFNSGDTRPMSFSERLTRLSMEARHTAAVAPLQDAVASRHLVLKRALDIAAAIVGLILTSPLFILIISAIKLESKGPIFYGDKREGFRGRGFSCWKFRTMYTNAHLAQRELKALDHTDGPHFKVDRDPRVTRVGRVLRALNVDEIPQLINVLLGQMSLVGPRPSPFRENQVCVPWRAARLSVRPGITGFWQVCRHNRSAGDFHQWIEYDLLYVQHLSLALDLKILAATALTLGGKAGHVPSEWLVRGASPVDDHRVTPHVGQDDEAQQVA